MRRKVRDIVVDGGAYTWRVAEQDAWHIVELRVWRPPEKAHWFDAQLDILGGAVTPAMVAGAIRERLTLGGDGRRFRLDADGLHPIG